MKNLKNYDVNEIKILIKKNILNKYDVIDYFNDINWDLKPNYINKINDLKKEKEFYINKFTFFKNSI